MPINPTIFIAGTDTNIGKTRVCGLLAAALSRAGEQVVTQKWVQTGSTQPDDLLTHLHLMNQNLSEIGTLMFERCPYQFKFPASPHLAAQLENKIIQAETLDQALKVLQSQFNRVLIEGSGGLMVPFNTTQLQIDIVQNFKLPVLLVAVNRLGTLNHTLLSVKALEQRQIPLLGLILNSVTEGEDPVIEKDNVAYLKTALKCPVYTLPFGAEDSRLLDNIAKTL